MLTIEEIDEVTARSIRNGCVLVDAPISGPWPVVDVSDLHTFSQLMGLARVAYVTRTNWGPTLRKQVIADIDFTGVAQVFDDLLEGQTCEVNVSVVLGGILHTITGKDPEFAHRCFVAADQSRRSRDLDALQTNPSDAEYAEVQRLIMSWARDHLLDALLVDDTWLALSERPAQAARAEQLITSRFREPSLHPQVLTEIVKVVAVAADQREGEVAVRTAAFLESIAEHGRRLAGTSAFAAAGHTSVGALADAYVRSVDRIVPVALVRDELLSHARPNSS